MKRVLAGVDAIIDETYYASGVPSPADVAASLGFASLAAARDAVPALEAGAVYRWDGERAAGEGGASGWFEAAVARPDWVLADLARALTPEAGAANKSLLALGPAAGESNGDFNFLLRVGAAGAPGAPRLLSAAACSAPAACGGGAARAEPAAICPNAYRDCATGALVQADPAKGCGARPDCPAVALAGNGAAAARGAGAATAVAALVAAAALAL